MIHLDTHVVVWRYSGLVKKFSAKVHHILDSEQCLISPIIKLELAFLREVGRIRENAGTIIARLSEEMALQIDSSSFDEVTEQALSQTWTRDPFDRIIVGQAFAANARIVTADEKMRSASGIGIW